jgi:hypothetical protein
VQETCGNNIEDLPWLRAEHAGEVQGLITGKGGVGGVSRGGCVGIGDPAAAHKDRV